MIDDGKIVVVTERPGAIPENAEFQLRNLPNIIRHCMPDLKAIPLDRPAVRNSVAEVEAARDALRKAIEAAPVPPDGSGLPSAFLRMTMAVDELRRHLRQVVEVPQ